MLAIVYGYFILIFLVFIVKTVLPNAAALLVAIVLFPIIPFFVVYVNWHIRRGISVLLLVLYLVLYLLLAIIFNSYFMALFKELTSTILGYIIIAIFIAGCIYLFKTVKQHSA